MARAQPAYTPAFLMIGPHLSISALRWARRAWRARSSPTGSVPSLAKRVLTSESLSASWRAPASLSIAGRGVPLGA